MTETSLWARRRRVLASVLPRERSWLSQQWLSQRPRRRIIPERVAVGCGRLRLIAARHFLGILKCSAHDYKAALPRCLTLLQLDAAVFYHN